MKHVTLYPGRYIFVCPCGYPYKVLTVTGIERKVSLYCFACKQETGKHYKVMDQELDFTYNWNNKLNCQNFTTIRLHNPRKYYNGASLHITLNGKHMGYAKIIEVRNFTIDQLNNYVTLLDTGYPAEECKKIIRQMYKNKPFIDWKNQLLDFCLIQYVKERNEPLLFEDHKNKRIDETAQYQ